MEKYYTPVLDDIMVNMPVQILEQNTTKMIRQVEWHDVIVTPNDNLIGKKIAFNRLVRLLKANKVRVKYLDLDDIESLGWNNYQPPHEYDHTWSLGNFELKAWFNGKIPMIRILTNNIMIFHGLTKNISELKELMNKVGINEP